MNDPTNVVGRRVLALLIDGLLLTILFAVVFLLFADSQEATGSNRINVTIGDTHYGVGGGKAALLYGLELLINFIYFVVIQGRTGATIGKALLGIRVQQEDGDFPPGILRCLVRWFF